jgi:uncharacterized membrane protein
VGPRSDDHRLPRWRIGTERGLHRLVNFSDAIVAIAITLLVLPLADSASTIGNSTLVEFLHHHHNELLAFGLSFIVIWNFWWAQHQMLENIVAYSRLLVIGLFVWTLSIVFLPFPTELLSSADHAGAGVHALYVGSMLLSSVAALVEQWAITREPELQAEEHRGEATLVETVVQAVLMGVVFVLVIVAPAVGLWWLLLLVLFRPLTRLARARRHDVVRPH